ncbi:MAG TPA: substrate-binding domain-containing protein [Usitatibacter sp.]|nr:substrate-binding domain-containing protein [Usitatibacter sp.]
MPRLIQLLGAIEEQGNLMRAARKLGISYRHAWGMIRDGARALGAPLLVMSRGRGATLSPLGEQLLWAERRVAARLAPIFRNLESELDMEIDRALRDPAMVFRMRVSHGFAVELLRDLLVEDRVPVDLKYCGSMEALAALAAGECEMAGFHTPAGALQAEALPFCGRWLTPGSQTLIVLCSRRQGLMTAAGNPLGLAGLADLARPGLRFVNRQFGSGTRILLDLLLAREGVESAAIAGYETGEFTHSAVAAFIASGMADAGFGVEAAACKFGLEFLPLVSERYFLVCHDDSLASPFVTRVLETLTSHRFRVAAGQIPGTDATLAGTVLAIGEAFPELAAADAGAPAKAEGRRKPATRTTQ